MPGVKDRTYHLHTLLSNLLDTYLGGSLKEVMPDSWVRFEAQIDTPLWKSHEFVRYPLDPYLKLHA